MNEKTKRTISILEILNKIKIHFINNLVMIKLDMNHLNSNKGLQINNFEITKDS